MQMLLSPIESSDLIADSKFPATRPAEIDAGWWPRRM